MELLKANYKEVKGSLYSTMSQVGTLVRENIAVKSKLKLLEEQALTSKKELEDLKQRLYDAKGSHDDLEQYTRKFNLVIHGIPERKQQDKVDNVIKESSQKYYTRTGPTKPEYSRSYKEKIPSTRFLLGRI